MKCPRKKFTDLNYNEDVIAQKKAICLACPDYLGEEKVWGEHCGAYLTCLMTGEKLGAEAFEKLPKHTRQSTTHTLSDEGRKQLNKKLTDLQKKTKRPLW